MKRIILCFLVICLSMSGIHIRETDVYANGEDPYYVNLFTGSALGATLSGNKNLGQRFIVPSGKVLKSLYFPALGTWGQTCDVDMEVYVWNTDFTTSKSGSVLASFHKDDHNDNEPINFVLDNVLLQGQYLVVFKRTEANGIATAYFTKQGDTTFFVEGTELSGKSANIKIGLIDEANYPVNYMDLYTGSVSGATFASNKNLGQRFAVPSGSLLKSIYFPELGTYGQTCDVNIDVYAWNTNFAMSKSGKILASFHRNNHKDNEPINFVLDDALPSGHYLIVFKRIEANGIAILYSAKKGNTAFFVEGTELSGMSANIKIGLIDDPINPINYVDLYTGPIVSATSSSKKNLGQRFVVPSGKYLKSIYFPELGTYGQTCNVDMEIYAWNTNFTTSKAGAVLASFHKDNHEDNEPIKFLIDGVLPAGQYLVVFKRIEANGIATAYFAKQGDTTFFVEGVELSGKSANIKIGLIEDPINPVNYVDLHTGSVEGATLASNKNLGQRFVVPLGKALKSINFPALGTWGQTCDVDIEVYSWNTNFTTSKTGTVLASFHKDNHSDNQPINFVLGNTLPSGQYLVVFKRTEANGIATLYYPKQGDTTFFVEGVELSGKSANINIGLIIPTNYVDLYTTRDAKSVTPSVGQNTAQRFIVPEGQFLKSIFFPSIPTYCTPSDVDLSIYAWNTNFSTSVAGLVLDTYHEDDHVDNAPVNFELDILLPPGEYIVVLNKTLGQTAAFWTYTKTGNTALFVNGIEQSGKSAEMKIGLINNTNLKYYESYPYTDYRNNHGDINITYTYSGAGGPGLVNAAAGAIGQKISIPKGQVLTYYALYPVAAGGNFDFDVYRWNTNYATTISGPVLTSKKVSGVPTGGGVELYFNNVYLPGGEYLILQRQTASGTTVGPKSGAINSNAVTYYNGVQVSYGLFGFYFTKAAIDLNSVNSLPAESSYSLDFTKAADRAKVTNATGANLTQENGILKIAFTMAGDTGINVNMNDAIFTEVDTTIYPYVVFRLKRSANSGLSPQLYYNNSEIGGAVGSMALNSPMYANTTGWQNVVFDFSEATLPQDSVCNYFRYDVFSHSNIGDNVYLQSIRFFRSLEDAKASYAYTLSGSNTVTENRVIAEGVGYKKIKTGSTFNNVQFDLMSIDLSKRNLYIDDVFGGVFITHAYKKTSTMTSEFNENANVALGATNADMWMTNAHARRLNTSDNYLGFTDPVVKSALPIPRGFNIRNGEIVCTSHMVQETPYEGDFWSFGITEDYVPIISNPTADVVITNVSKNSISNADGINRLPANNALVMYTDRGVQNNQALDDAYEVKIQITSTPDYIIKHNTDITGVVVGIYTPSNPSSNPTMALNSNYIILTARGDKVSKLSSYSIGDEINIKVFVSDKTGKYTALWQRAVEAVGGHTPFVQNGEVQSGGLGIGNPATIIGVTKEGTVIMGTLGTQTTGRRGMSAESYNQLGWDLNLKEALILDGGGSSTAVIKDAANYIVANNPSDGTERQVVNCLVISIGSIRGNQGEVPPIG